jgi:hypothetical protein
MKRIYIAGPMTGLPELNFPAFHAAAKALRAQGHHVENPAEINADPKAQWLDCMRADIARLVTCDAVLMLPGWQNSRGALVEHGLAVGLGLQVLHARELRAINVPARRRTVFRCGIRGSGTVDVKGWELECGAVLHRTLFSGRKFRSSYDDAWTVSDPVTGGAMARGDSLAQAVRSYRELVRRHGDAWTTVLAEKRKAFIADRDKQPPKAGKKGALI